MDLFSILLIAFGLSMDSFAVAISRGICTKQLIASQAIKLAAIFGFFQGLMPLIGYFAGHFFAEKLTEIDHWLAFFILGIIGFKMIFDSLSKSKKEAECDCEGGGNCKNDNFGTKFLITLAIATSIDALATGLIFTPFSDQILIAAAIIGLITFIMAFIGLSLGFLFDSKLKFNFEIVGGIVLIGIGTRILLEHL